jgi:hypothetical protein
MNYWDFWHKIAALRAYCVVCLKLPLEKSLSVPAILRALLSQAEFDTKKKRLGKVISWSDGRVSWYT